MMNEKIVKELIVIQAILNTVEMLNEENKQAVKLIEVAREKTVKIFKLLEQYKFTED